MANQAYKFDRDEQGRYTIRTSLRGADLLTQTICNKGTAFTRSERAAFRLEGLLPVEVNSMHQQLKRIYASIQRKADPLEKYIGLAALQDRNEHLFYRLISEHIEDFAPIVYTPTVGKACQRFSRIFRNARGLWITPDQQGGISKVLSNAPQQDIRLIVVTDNERILGLGDQGAGGMGIPVGKLSLYSVAAGIHPSQTLPVSLDVGTDNQSLLDDPLYLGWRQERLRGERYHEIVDEFVRAVQQLYPQALLQWEDFKKSNAITLMERYRERILSFNDDIQGTAAVAVAGVLAGLRAVKGDLKQQRAVILGAGAAGIGIARQLREALRQAGLRGSDLTRSIAVLDSRGLLFRGRGFQESDAYKREFAWPEGLMQSEGLTAEDAAGLPGVVEALQPSILIGTSGQPGTFTEGVIRNMARHAKRPIIFPFSNPTDKSEAHPRDLLNWTEGRALVATGSPFEPVESGGRSVRIGQGNNVFVFPGIGLGALVAEARQVTDSMFRAASEMLAKSVSQQDLEAGTLFPRIRELRPVSARIAEAVVRDARDSGVGIEIGDQEIKRRVALAMWDPTYPRMVAV